jgi:protein transport protein SEC24
MTSPPPAPRASRRQYAANTAAYIAGDTSGVGAPLTSGHGHSQSQQFFSPASHDPNSQLFTPGARDFGGGAAAAQGFQQPGIPPYAGGQQGVQGMANQFGQMGLGGQKQMQVVSSTNLIGQALNPAEMMSMSPPEIRLPPNVSCSELVPLARGSC